MPRYVRTRPATVLAIVGIHVAGERPLAKDDFHKFNLQGALRVSEKIPGPKSAALLAGLAESWFHAQIRRP